MPQTPSTRWCPTPEQLMILEEMYRTGVRTPNASQIQQITAHLSFYGKIEGKNVFYWFQNHKARDRQKLRRRLSRQQQLLHSLQAHQPPMQQFQEDSNTSPTSHQTTPLPLPLPLPLHCTHQLQGPGPAHQEVAQGMNLLSKLEIGEPAVMPPPASAAYGGYDQWMMMMMAGESSSSDGQHTCCRPLKTLELFPTKSTGLKDECSTSKSSSCSTSTN